MTMNETYRYQKPLQTNRAYSPCPDATNWHLIDVRFSRSSDVHLNGLHKASTQCLTNAKNLAFLAQKAKSKSERY